MEGCNLRNGTARNLVRVGVRQRVALSISGHKTRSILDRYNIVSDRDLRDATPRTQDYLIATAAEEAKRKPAEMRRQIENGHGYGTILGIGPSRFGTKIKSCAARFTCSTHWKNY